MSKSKIAHITYKGRPLCQCPQFANLGLPSQCSFKSIAAARRAVKILQKHAWGFKVITGACPTSEG